MTVPALPNRNAPLAKPTSPALSQGLRLLLECESSADEAVSGILANPALHAEVRAALPALLARVGGCGEDHVSKVVGRRLATYPQPERSDEEWTAWWSDYHDALSDLPAEALEAGMRAWVRRPDAEFMPKPGQLRELALKAGEPLWTAASRARRAALTEVREPPKLAPVEERKAQAAEILASLHIKKMGSD